MDIVVWYTWQWIACSSAVIKIDYFVMQVPLDCIVIVVRGWLKWMYHIAKLGFLLHVGILWCHWFDGIISPVLITHHHGWEWESICSFCWKIITLLKLLPLIPWTGELISRISERFVKLGFEYHCYQSQWSMRWFQELSQSVEKIYIR